MTNIELTNAIIEIAGIADDLLTRAQNVIMPVQTHSARVGLLDATTLAAIEKGTPVAEIFPATDGLITTLPGIRIGVRTADCVPVLINCPDIGAVAAVHAGWRGTFDGIVIRAMEMLRDMGADPRKAEAVIAPCISVDAYEVSDELAEKFMASPLCGRDVAVMYGDRYHLDLRECNARQLQSAGMDRSRIVIDRRCTFADSGLYSYRRVAGERGRNISSIMLHSTPGD